ncbi:DUF3369 domain-containing protein [Vibrio sp.]|uniref:DUF3369 domain-containing protein n=1 Tax=Vibrio sp. TaxID=678 RepID=UPI003D0A93FA
MDFFADTKPALPEDNPENGTTFKYALKPWKVLLVDDDEQVHLVTKMALRGFTFQHRKLELLSAMSGLEAKKILDDHTDIALALIDVVMETEHAGLELVEYIRNSHRNHNIRLVLRTGQAGQAPEDKVIQQYDIDDYKEKTELTTQKLRTLMYSMLRAYRDLCLIEEQKQGLKRVIEASANVQNTTTLKTYAEAVLHQLTSLLHLPASGFYCVVKPSYDSNSASSLTLAAIGGFVDLHTECNFNHLPKLVAERCQDVLKEKKSQTYPDATLLYMLDSRGYENLLYINLIEPLDEASKNLLDIYMQNIALTFNNLNLQLDIRETSRELVHNLANAVEARSKETGAHVQRVSLFCEKLALLYGLPEEEAYMIQHASPLHDIGKVAIPDAILHKPAKLDADEWEIMKKHVDYGVQILSKSTRPLIIKAKEIAGTHHEKWDGSGYPNGLQGQGIPISGRITALADVFDALGSKRSYKEPWSEDDIKTEIVKQKGLHFEPLLVDLLIEHWSEFVAIRDKYPD